MSWLERALADYQLSYRLVPWTEEAHEFLIQIHWGIWSFLYVDLTMSVDLLLTLLSDVNACHRLAPDRVWLYFLRHDKGLKTLCPQTIYVFCSDRCYPLPWDHWLLYLEFLEYLYHQSMTLDWLFSVCVWARVYSCRLGVDIMVFSVILSYILNSA